MRFCTKTEQCERGIRFQRRFFRVQECYVPNNESKNTSSILLRAVDQLEYEVGKAISKSGQKMNF